MAYDNVQGHLISWSGTGLFTAANLAATAADWAVAKVHHPIQVKRISFFVTTAVTAGTTAPKVTVYSRPTSASASGQATLGVLTIPNGAAVGAVYYKDLESVRVQPGYDLAFVVSLQATDGGTAAGAGFAVARVLEDHEVPANLSKMIASA